ncbi:SBF domain containing protein, partial [Asbolus verrucosus]
QKNIVSITNVKSCTGLGQNWSRHCAHPPNIALDRLGKILFPYNPEMQLGMFFTGVSPAGGASNIWTVVLDGNIDLSITMTTISTLAAFGMMPLFELFSWQIVIAGMELPYLGYLLGYCMAKLLKQPPPDCLAIATETGIAIFLLRFTLPQPETDLTTVAPVAVATMTPLPLLIMFFYKKIQTRISPSYRKLNVKNAVKDSNTDNNFNAPKDDRLIPTIS